MAVEIGDEAPDFELPDQHGTPVKLSSFRGSKNVVLVFYPLAFSPVCSGELCALREDFPEVTTRDDVELLTVSVDSLFSHRVWAEQENFQFSLLADFWPHGAVAKQYGVFDEARGLAIRGTFVIDKEGVVRWSVVNPIPQARDIADYQKALAELALPARWAAEGRFLAPRPSEGREEISSSAALPLSRLPAGIQRRGAGVRGGNAFTPPPAPTSAKPPVRPGRRPPAISSC
jgi:peroxiredoxin